MNTLLVLVNLIFVLEKILCAEENDENNAGQVGKRFVFETREQKQAWEDELVADLKADFARKSEKRKRADATAEFNEKMKDSEDNVQDLQKELDDLAEKNQPKTKNERFVWLAGFDKAVRFMIPRVSKLRTRSVECKFLKFCVVARGEIEKLDQYTYEARDPNGNGFINDEHLINAKQGYYSQQNERRRQRIRFALDYSTSTEIDTLKKRLGGITLDVFADKISQAYSTLSKTIHEYGYKPGFEGKVSYHSLEVKEYNKYLNILLEGIDWEVGKMEDPTTKKP